MFNKNEQLIGSEKTYGHPKILDSLSTMMQRTANQSAASLRSICKRSDQPRKPMQS